MNLFEKKNQGCTRYSEFIEKGKSKQNFTMKATWFFFKQCLRHLNLLNE